MNPKSERNDALAARAESLLENGQLQEAEETIRTALKESHRKWQHYFILARIWDAQHRDSDAMAAFRHAVAQAPLVAQTHGGFGQFLLQKGELREAEREMRTAISLNPNASGYHATLGSVLMQQCFYDEALVSLQKAIRLDRRNPTPRIIMGELSATMGKYAAAEKSLGKALALAPDSSRALSVLGKILEDQGKFDSAIKCAKRRLTLNPKNASVHVQVANLFMRTGRVNEAEQAVRDALVLQPAAATFANLCAILQVQSRWPEAASAMGEACRLDPENPIYRQRLAKLKDPNDKQVRQAENVTLPPSRRKNPSLGFSVIGRLRKLLGR